MIHIQMIDIGFTIRPEQYVEIHEWCKENFGPESMETWKLLANNDVGLQIKEVWDDNYPDKPIIILKPEKWIINENTKRREKKTK